MNEESDRMVMASIEPDDSIVRRADMDLECALQEQKLLFDQSLSELAHELRSPLAPMQTALEILSQESNASEQSLALIALMQRQFGRLIQIVDELSSVSKSAARISSDNDNVEQQMGFSQSIMKKEILVVDDTRAAAYTLRKLLESLGQNVRTASCASSAMDAIREKAPDIVFSDIGMPSTDGYELARMIRTLPVGDSVHLIAVTGYGHSADRKMAFEAGFDDHVVKPINYATIKKILSNANGGSKVKFTD